MVQFSVSHRFSWEKPDLLESLDESQYCFRGENYTKANVLRFSDATGFFRPIVLLSSAEVNEEKSIILRILEKTEVSLHW